jgi:hypothetical protein
MSDVLKHFYIGAPWVREDGTEDELRLVLIKHTQTNPEIIHRACREISDYINFCMDISTDVFSLDRNDYVHIKKENENVDPMRTQIHLYGSYDHPTNVIALTDEVSDPYLKGCLSLMKRSKQASYFPTAEDNARLQLYGRGYKFLFSELLDGIFYFPNGE